MLKFQPPKYNKVTLAAPNTGIRESVIGISGYRSSLGHLNSPLYKSSKYTIQIKPTINQVLCPRIHAIICVMINLVTGQFEILIMCQGEKCVINVLPAELNSIV